MKVKKSLKTVIVAATTVAVGIPVYATQADEKSDTWVIMNVKTALVFNYNVYASKTDVYVKDGIVTLRGEANSQSHKELTAEYIKDIEGVKGVVNYMTTKV